ncbi:Uncharacterised protein [uncultured archaeon]|nr:Uncharacterised protein [uncultured archaeon]
MSSKRVVRKKKLASKNSSGINFVWKLIGILFLLFLLYILFKGMTGNFVYSDISYQLDRGISTVQPIFQFLLGGNYYDSQLLFEKFLFFLLILGFVFIVLKNMPLFTGQKNILVVVSLVVSILSVRYINYEWLMTMILTYSVLGVALISLLPFVIFFFFLNGVAPNSATVRKIGWVLFTCVYIGLWVSADNPFYSKVYAWTAVVSVLFLWADGTIHRYLKAERIKAMGKNTIEDAEVEFRRRMHQLRTDLANGIINQAYFNERMKDYEARIKSLHKYS